MPYDDHVCVGAALSRVVKLISAGKGRMEILHPRL